MEPDPWLTIKELACPEAEGGLGRGRTWVQALRRAMELEAAGSRWRWRIERVGHRQFVQRRSVCREWIALHPDWTAGEIYRANRRVRRL